MLKAPTFARRPVTAPPAPAAGLGGAPQVHPLLLVLGAVALVILAGVVLISTLGDPHAGAPSVHVSLDPKGPPNAALGDLRRRLGLDGAAPAAGALPEMRTEGAPPAGGAVDPLTAQIGGAETGGGQAVITLPQGGSLGGGEGRGPAPRPAASPLPAAPIPGLFVPSSQGNLPIIAKDGRTPFQAYARPFHDTGKPKVALIVGGLGLNAAATRAAIERLPPEITLSFVPYAEGLQSWIDLARTDGHEVLLEIPMEPSDYPNNDPGPSTLMANAPREELTRRLEWLLGRASGYFGVTNYLGGRFMTADGAMTSFMTALRGRGLAFLDDGSAARRSGGGLPRASADHVVDEQLSAESIERQLNELASGALAHGQALGAGFAYPVTLNEVVRWSQGLAARGVQLAPASALTHR